MAGPVASRARQFGGMMIESLVGLLILSLVGGGVMHATARMANTQQQQTVNNIAVNQMRSLLMNRTNTAGADICSGAQSLTLPGQTTAVTLTVKGCGNTNVKIKNVTIGGAAVGEQTVSTMRPVVLELGSDNSLIRVGGQEVPSIATN
jgi:type II secretory pathway pseudopilin PulG